MKTAGMAVRGLGVVMLVLGLVIWTGNDSIVPLHMLIGIAFVISLWAVALLAARAGVAPGLVVVAFAWGILLAAFGMVQEQILPGDGHAVVEVAHLAIGVIAIGIGEALAGRARRTGSA